MRSLFSGWLLVVILVAAGCGKPKVGEGSSAPPSAQTAGEKAKPASLADKQGSVAAPVQAEKVSMEGVRSDPLVQVVLAEGAGTTPDEALRDAFRNAVRQVVGAYVDADTRVKNDEVIADEVLTYSDGLVKKYEEVSKKTDKGLARIKIKAAVERRSVITRLKAAKVKVTEVDGKGIFAEVVTDLEAGKNARALLAKALEGFPLNVLQVETVGKPKVVGKKDGGAATIAVLVRIRADQKAFDTFARGLQERLSKLAKDKGEFLLVGKDAGPRKKKRSASKYVGMGVTTYFEAPKNWNQYAPKAFPAKGGRNPVAVALNTRRTGANDRTEWNYYLLDDSTKDLLDELSKKKYEVKLTVFGSDDVLIASDRFEAATNLGYGDISCNLVKRDRLFNRAKHDHFFTVSPLFFDVWKKIYPYGIAYFPFFQTSRTINLSLDELKSIKRIKAELVEASK